MRSAFIRLTTPVKATIRSRSGTTEFRPIRRRFRRATAFCAQDDYPVVQFMSANDCNLRPIRLVKQFSPPRPRLSTLPPCPSPSALFRLVSSASLACRKVQNTRRKRAIRDRTPLTFHFSWSKIIRSPSYVL